MVSTDPAAASAGVPIPLQTDPQAPQLRRRSADTEPVAIHLAASPGGHLDLLVAVADALGDRPTIWLTEEGQRAETLGRDGRTVHGLPPFKRTPRRVLANVWRAAQIVWHGRPRLVVCSGAGLVVPFCTFARLLGARIVFIETMARVHDPSASGRVLSRLADTVIVQWPEMAQVYPQAVVCRPALCEDVADTPVTEGRGTFVAVGFHDAPFDRLLAAVDRALEAGVLQGPAVAQAGPSTYPAQHFGIVPYLGPEEVNEAVSRARHVVCHAGAGIISTSLRAGRRPLVMARRADRNEHVDDHQIQILRKLAEMALVVPIEGDIGEAEALKGTEPPNPAGAENLPSVRAVLAGALRAYEAGGRARA
jgi:UDP-N-acetylglucosamine--N-acetylmuramyl-(pentapeptide) pyrophosphoryl-undecaprenol N-acetylglucosamine transferase